MLGDVTAKRVLLVDMPALLRDIVREALVPESGLELIVEHEQTDLAAAAESHRPDVVVTAARSDGHARHYALLHSHPRLRVLAVVARGDSAYAYELRPAYAELSAPSALGLRELVRTAAHDSSWELPLRGGNRWQT